MRGAIGAGHPLTARAGARTLAEGGNAVDACVAAAFAAWVAESPLTGPGAGGFMLVYRSREADARLLDFFVSIPGKGAAPGIGGGMETVEVRFDRRTTQRFQIGGASCAVPGSALGLAEAHRRYGVLPWPVLLEPAIELARAGVELNGAQAYIHSALDGVLRSTPESRRVYGLRRAVAKGERIELPDLAGTLERIAAEGASCLYRGELARTVAAAVCDAGGQMTEQDLSSYRVVARRPVRTAYRGYELLTNPPPSSGGVLVAFALRLLDRIGGNGGGRGSAGAIAALAEIMGAAARARSGRFESDLRRGGLSGRLLADETVERELATIGTRLGRAILEPSGIPSTTHISVVDGEGNAASHSTSTGCGSGVVVPGTGIHLNNMLGEEDLNPTGRSPAPGERLTSMMAPSLLLHRGRPRLVVGSAGSIRLRNAIVQIIVNVVDHGLTLREAIEAPRVHLEGELLHLEGGVGADVAEALARAGYGLVRWRDRNLYFGGASAVTLNDRGELEAAGDPRRDGAGVVVEAESRL